MKRNDFLRHAAALAALSVLGAAPIASDVQAASDYPNKPVRIIVGVPPGGTTDLVARMVGDQLGRQLGQSFVVENRAGAAGNIGAELVAKSAPDGYTLFLAPIGTMAINPSLYSNIPFDPLKDFAAISQLTSLPMVMLVHPSVPARTPKELIEYARSNPGKLNFASGGAAPEPISPASCSRPRRESTWFTFRTRETRRLPPICSRDAFR